MPDTDPCELCNTEAEAIESGGYDGIHQKCPRCGEFKLSGTGMAVIHNVSRDDKVKLSGWVCNQNMLGAVPELTSDRIRSIAELPLPGLVERADRLLSLAVRKQHRLGESFTITDPRFLAVTYSKDINELNYLAQFYTDAGFIKYTGMGGLCEVTPKGYMRFEEEIQKRQVVSAQGFVAMWIHDTMEDAYLNGFEVAIRAAGYDPIRVDRVEHVGKIDDEIIAQINRSRFVVADFTGHRGGVYFEAGYAMGLGIPVIWTCRADYVEKLHFDTRQYNHIVWESVPQLKDRLRDRIAATAVPAAGGVSY